MPEPWELFSWTREHDVTASRGSQLFCSCVCLGCRQPPCALWLEANQGHTEDRVSSPSGFTFGSALDLGKQAHSVCPPAQLGASVENIRETPKQACRPGRGSCLDTSADPSLQHPTVSILPAHSASCSVAS